MGGEWVATGWVGKQGFRRGKRDGGSQISYIYYTHTQVMAGKGLKTSVVYNHFRVSAQKPIMHSPSGK